jgi:hypothetical protein
MPLSQLPVDYRIHLSMKSRLERAIALALEERDRLRREREWIREENRRLTMEVARLAQENEALRGSAEIWIRMYEQTLARANRAERPKDAPVG